MKAGTRRLETKTSKTPQYYDNDDDGTTEREGDTSMRKGGANYGSDSEDDMQFGRIATGNRQRIASIDSEDLNSQDSRRITTFVNTNAFGEDPSSYDPRRDTTNLINTRGTAVSGSKIYSDDYM